MNQGNIRSRLAWLAAAWASIIILGCSGSNAIRGGDDPVITHTYYGSCINADDIANVIIGWYVPNGDFNASISYRMRVTQGGSLVAIRPFFIWSSTRAGYQGGTGGTIQIEVQSDDGTSSHRPSGTVLASLTYTPPVTSTSSASHYPLLTFPTPATLAAGQLCHIVFTDVDPDPKTNWVSLDTLWTWRGTSPEQPTTPSTDLAILERGVGAHARDWSVYTRGGGLSGTPIIELDFDTYTQGQGYIQGFGAPDASFVNPKPICGENKIRETFAVSGASKVVSAVAVRVNRLSGASPLNVTVEKADGTRVGGGSVVVPMGGPATSSDNGATWVKVTFPSPLMLQSGVSYNLVLTSPSDTVHATHVLQKGRDYGFKPGAYFGDGHAEFTAGSGWKGWDLWGLSNLQVTDLQFYFEVNP